jgi:hypothetical protein
MCGLGAMYEREGSSAKLRLIDLTDRRRAGLKILAPLLLPSVLRKKD